ncbi:MAG TPA: hypothetical protein VMB34_08695 [Acetobacteraceae bacterium]|nr:hypothetical protein [Acetobacteraceae bacterium]
MSYPSGRTYSWLTERLNTELALLPSTHRAVAWVQFHSQTIHLNTISHSQLLFTSYPDIAIDLATPFSILCHELAHWFDLVSTRWGQSYLIDLFDAYEVACNKNTDLSEDDFWRVVRSYDNDRRIMFPGYYRTINPDASEHGVRNPWFLQCTTGLEFNPDGRLDPKRPIFFAVFGENPSGQRLARQPLSVGALLECIAVHSELLAEFGIANAIADGDTRTVELAIRSRERGRSWYDPSLTEYTAAAHLLSISTHTVEPMITYELASAVAFLCLNLSPEHFQRLKLHGRMRDIPPARVTAFKKMRDPGFAFATIVAGAPQYPKFQGDHEAWLEDALHRVNLPKSRTIHETALGYLNSRRRTLLSKWSLDSTRDYLLDVGRDILRKRLQLGISSNVLTVLRGGAPMPPVFDADGVLFSLGEAQLERNLFDPERMYDLQWDLRKFSENFLKACRIS